MLYPTELRPRVGVAQFTGPAHRAAVPRRLRSSRRGYFIVGMTNCAPSRAAVGQRDVTVFSRV